MLVKTNVADSTVQKDGNSVACLKELSNFHCKKQNNGGMNKALEFNINVF